MTGSRATASPGLVPQRTTPAQRISSKMESPKGKGPFVTVPYNPPAEVTDKEYPFVLTTGRNLFQYHSGSMTRRVGSIEKHAGEAYVELDGVDGRRPGSI